LLHAIYGTVRRIRENPRLADLPMLAVTAYAMQGYKERMLNAGFDGYLSKPIDGDTAFPGIAPFHLRKEHLNAPGDHDDRPELGSKVRSSRSQELDDVYGAVAAGTAPEEDPGAKAYATARKKHRRSNPFAKIHVGVHIQKLAA
jgi:CheY-like chemotaxis protein